MTAIAEIVFMDVVESVHDERAGVIEGVGFRG